MKEPHRKDLSRKGSRYAINSKERLKGGYCALIRHGRLKAQGLTEKRVIVR